jgi:hypothetical protein
MPRTSHSSGFKGSAPRVADDRSQTALVFSSLFEGLVDCQRLAHASSFKPHNISPSISSQKSTSSSTHASNSGTWFHRSPVPYSIEIRDSRLTLLWTLLTYDAPPTFAQTPQLVHPTALLIPVVVFLILCIYALIALVYSHRPRHDSRLLSSSGSFSYISSPGPSPRVRCLLNSFRDTLPATEPPEIPHTNRQRPLVEYMSDLVA